MRGSNVDGFASQWTIGLKCQCEDHVLANMHIFLQWQFLLERNNHCTIMDGVSSKSLWNSGNRYEKCVKVR